MEVAIEELVGVKSTVEEVLPGVEEEAREEELYRRNAPPVHETCRFRSAISQCFRTHARTKEQECNSTDECPVRLQSYPVVAQCFLNCLVLVERKIAQSCLEDLLQYDGEEDGFCRYPVPSLDFFRLMQTVLVEEGDMGVVDDLPEARSDPVKHNWGQQAQILVADPGKEGCIRRVVCRIA